MQKFCEPCICELELIGNIPSMDFITEIAAIFFEQSKEKILSKNREEKFTKPRHFSIYYMDKIGYKPKDIIKYFNYKKHTSVIRTRESVNDRFFSNKQDLTDYNKFTQLIQHSK